MERRCARCGAIFYAERPASQQRYCTPHCAKVVRRAQDNEYQREQAVQIKARKKRGIDELSDWYIKYLLHNVTASQDCIDAKRKEIIAKRQPERICPHCGKTFLASAEVRRVSRRVYCSAACQKANSKQRHRERIRFRDVLYRQANKSKIRARKKAKWERMSEEKRQRVYARQRVSRAKGRTVLADWYIKNQLGFHTPSHDLIEAKRMQIALKRQLKAKA